MSNPKDKQDNSQTEIPARKVITPESLEARMDESERKRLIETQPRSLEESNKLAADAKRAADKLIYYQINSHLPDAPDRELSASHTMNHVLPELQKERQAGVAAIALDHERKMTLVAYKKAQGEKTRKAIENVAKPLRLKHPEWSNTRLAQEVTKTIGGSAGHIRQVIPELGLGKK